MNVEELKEAFIIGCSYINGHILSHKNKLVCITKSVRIELDKSGKWIKAYEEVGQIKSFKVYALKVFGIPEEIRVERKNNNQNYLIIKIKGLNDEINILSIPPTSSTNKEILLCYIDQKLEEPFYRKFISTIKSTLSKK